MRRIVYVTRQIPEAGLRLLRRKRNLDVRVFHKDRPMSAREIRKHARGAEVLLALLTDRIDGEIMDAIGPQLRMIANYAVGFDNINLEAAKARGITVTNAPGPELSNAVAEHVIALIFTLAHRITEGDALARAGKYRGWGPMMLLGNDIAGKTLGIVGAGAIGAAVAHALHHGFGTKVVYFDVKRNERIEQETGATYLSLAQLFKRADIVSLHVPLLPSTRHLINAKALRSMKRSAYLINTARGPVVDETALINALRHGIIAGAALDVYEHEPHIPRALRRLPNAVLTPHTASATHGARNAMSITAATNILAYLQGDTPPNAIVT